MIPDNSCQGSIARWDHEDSCTSGSSAQPAAPRRHHGPRDRSGARGVRAHRLPRHLRPARRRPRHPGDFRPRRGRADLARQPSAPGALRGGRDHRPRPVRRHPEGHPAAALRPERRGRPRSRPARAVFGASAGHAAPAAAHPRRDAGQRSHEGVAGHGRRHAAVRLRALLHGRAGHVLRLHRPLRRALVAAHRVRRARAARAGLVRRRLGSGQGRVAHVPHGPHPRAHVRRGPGRSAPLRPGHRSGLPRRTGRPRGVDRHADRVFDADPWPGRCAIPLCPGPAWPPDAARGAVLLGGIRGERGASPCDRGTSARARRPRALPP